jgi:hypothetical protein
VSVLGRVMLAGLFGVMRGIVEVAFRYMCVVASLFVVASLVVVRCSIVMFGGLFMVVGCFAMVIRYVFGHVELSFNATVMAPEYAGT